MHDSCCDVLFLPDVNEMYPQGQVLETKYALGYTETILEGASRPGHFQGVAQVVDKLLDIVMPDKLYMGQKDYQQVAIIHRLLEIKESNIHLVIVPTKREQDGLAMSSRNKRLTEPQRNVAGVIYQCLVSVQSKQGLQAFTIIKKECDDLLVRKGFKLDYIALVDAKTLEILEDYAADKQMVALIAVFIGEVRLIDNLIFEKASEN